VRRVRKVTGLQQQGASRTTEGLGFCRPRSPEVASCACPPPAGTICLINAERSAHGLRVLKLDAKLDRASRRHSADMVAQRYFAHDSRSGARFSARIARTGWMNGRGRWSVGENLAWGSGTQATPASIVAAWMRSADHRHNILSPRFRVIGIGIVRGTPVGTDGATYTTDFGG
jgi:uncharacterized protein YkwD